MNCIYPFLAKFCSPLSCFKPANDIGQVHLIVPQDGFFLRHTFLSARILESTHHRLINCPHNRRRLHSVKNVGLLPTLTLFIDEATHRG